MEMIKTTIEDVSEGKHLKEQSGEEMPIITDKSSTILTERQKNS